MTAYVFSPAGKKPSNFYGRRTSCPDSSGLGVVAPHPRRPESVGSFVRSCRLYSPYLCLPWSAPVVRDSTYTSWRSSNCWRRLGRHKHLSSPALL